MLVRLLIAAALVALVASAVHLFRRSRPSIVEVEMRTGAADRWPWIVLLVAILPVVGCNRGKSSSGSPTGPDCDVEFDRAQHPDKWIECKKCEKVHRGMGTMEVDCKTAIPKPWK